MFVPYWCDNAVAAMYSRQQALGDAGINPDKFTFDNSFIAKSLARQERSSKMCSLHIYVQLCGIQFWSSALPNYVEPSMRGRKHSSWNTGWDQIQKERLSQIVACQQLGPRRMLFWWLVTCNSLGKDAKHWNLQPVKGAKYEGYVASAYKTLEAEYGKLFTSYFVAKFVGFCSFKFWSSFFTNGFWQQVWNIWHLWQFPACQKSWDILRSNKNTWF